MILIERHYLDEWSSLFVYSNFIKIFHEWLLNSIIKCWEIWTLIFIGKFSWNIFLIIMRNIIVSMDLIDMNLRLIFFFTWVSKVTASINNPDFCPTLVILTMNSDILSGDFSSRPSFTSRFFSSTGMGGLIKINIT